MSTLPLIFWKVSFGESNRFAHQELRKENAKGLAEIFLWSKVATRHHIEGVHGVLWYPSSNVPLPTIRALYWAYGAIMYPFVNEMPLWHFQQIRSVLHFNDNQMMPLNGNALHKVRPLVNIVKVALRAFIRVGLDLMRLWHLTHCMGVP
jgi:hypothetical protein